MKIVPFCSSFLWQNKIWRKTITCIVISGGEKVFHRYFLELCFLGCFIYCVCYYVYMAKKDILTKKQILVIPTLLKKLSIREIAEKYEVSWQAIFYWIKQLRKRGVKVKTRPQGSVSKIL